MASTIPRSVKRRNEGDHTSRIRRLSNPRSTNLPSIDLTASTAPSQAGKSSTQEVWVKISPSQQTELFASKITNLENERDWIYRQLELAKEKQDEERESLVKQQKEQKLFTTSFAKTTIINFGAGRCNKCTKNLGVTFYLLELCSAPWCEDCIQSPDNNDCGVHDLGPQKPIKVFVKNCSICQTTDPKKLLVPPCGHLISRDCMEQDAASRFQTPGLENPIRCATCRAVMMHSDWKRLRTADHCW